ncbi:E3 ubiquitin-protein ligase RHA2A [Malania oleifera]|uniref:E3 ubiquitin-protein ligase RHA2A n=1 Tax=Malania oleifera TaxID=397392 RepID=UPI0025AE5313|nr:E3 ubiquitin-protein ligase RHA2A [Malania oleifera]
MGLHTQLTDVPTDSILLLMVALLGMGMRYLRSLLSDLLETVGLSRFVADEVDEGLFGPVGSGLTSLIVLAEQLNFNRVVSFRYGGDGDPGGVGGDCVVCMCALRDGEQVRRLACRHVFHKECFDGWLDHLNFNCPLCRSPIVSEERVAAAERRVTGDIRRWFPLR